MCAHPQGRALYVTVALIRQGLLEETFVSTRSEKPVGVFPCSALGVNAAFLALWAPL